MESNEFFYEKCDCCGSMHRSDKECKECAEMERELLDAKCRSWVDLPDDQDELPF